MRHVFFRFTTLFSAALLLSSAGAAAGPPEATAPAETKDTIRQRANNLTGYYAFALRLTGRQRRAVLACTYRHLQQLDSVQQVSVAYADRSVPAANEQLPQGVSQVQHTYEATMGRILTTGQFSTFHWLRSQ